MTAKVCIPPLAILLAASLALVACKRESGDQAAQTRASQTPQSTQTTDEIQTMVTLQTSMGSIQIQLDHDKAPISSANFLQYCKDGFYDNLIFHRVIDGFMIQGGGMTADMQERPTTHPPIQNEADNGLTNLRGTIAMARTSDPHSASSQFFINVTDNDFLNHKEKSGNGWGYAVFGRVAEGMDVVDSIRVVPTGNRAGHQNVPLSAITIESTSC